MASEKRISRRRYFSIPDVAALLGLSRIAVYKKVKRGEIRAIKIGKAYGISSAYVAELLGKNVSQPKRKKIERAVKRVVREYGELLQLLGKE